MPASALLALFATLILLGFSLFNIYILYEDKVVITYLLNPFKSKLVLLYCDIEKIIVIRNTMSGSSTVLKIFLKHNASSPIKIFSVALLKTEYNMLVDSLNKTDIEIEKICV
jgi:hypothetical protein